MKSQLLYICRIYKTSDLKIIHRPDSLLSKSPCVEMTPQTVQQLQKYQRWICTAQTESSYQTLYFSSNNRNTEQHEKELKNIPGNQSDSVQTVQMELPS